MSNSINRNYLILSRCRAIAESIKVQLHNIKYPIGEIIKNTGSGDYNAGAYPECAAIITIRNLRIVLPRNYRNVLSTNFESDAELLRVIEESREIVI